MKLHLDRAAAGWRFTGYGDDHVLINGERHERGLLLSDGGIEIAPWAGLGFDALAPAHFAWLAERRADVLLFGTGSRLRFPPPALIRPLIAAKIGLEVMDNGALCRTYNILVAEGRDVAAALLFDRA